MRKVYSILFFVMLVCVGCQWQLSHHDSEAGRSEVSLERFDRIESLYLTTGDYAALQQMNTSYPTQTRMLIEDMLRLGKVDDPAINTKFLHFFQDSTLQRMLLAVQRQYADADDINEELSAAFGRMREELPHLETPQIYAQIGSFDQSIIVGNNMLGVSLDKYLGEDYPFYQDHYSLRQRKMMTRDMIVPDCLSFFLLSQYPPAPGRLSTPQERDSQMGRIQWVVNRLVSRKVFDSGQVTAVEEYMRKNSACTVKELLENNSVSLKKND